MFDVMATHMRVSQSEEYKNYAAGGGQLSPYEFERRPQDIASAEANIQTTPSMFADAETKEVLENAIKAQEDNTKATNEQAKQLRFLNRRLSENAGQSAEDFMYKLKPSGPARGGF